MAALVAAMLAAAGQPSRAQTAASLKTGMIGQWDLSTAERGKTCVVTLKADAVPQGGSHGGMKLELEPGCAARCVHASIVACASGARHRPLADAAATGDRFYEVESGFSKAAAPRRHLPVAESARRGRRRARWIR